MPLLHCCPFLLSVLSIFLRHLCPFHCCLFLFISARFLYCYLPFFIINASFLLLLSIPISLLPISYFIAALFSCHFCPFLVLLMSIFIPLLPTSYITSAHFLDYHCRFSAVAVHFLYHCCQFPILSLLFSYKVLLTKNRASMLKINLIGASYQQSIFIHDA